MASGNTIFKFKPKSNEPPSSGFATPDERNGHSVLDFSGATNQSGIFSDVLIRNYGGNGITVHHHYSMSSATANTIDLDGAFERVGDEQQDIDSDGFATAVSANNNTVPATSGHVKIVSIPFTNAEIDGLLVGEKFRYKLTRDADSDDASGDLELHLIEGVET